MHRSRRPSRCDSLETHAHSSIRRLLDDVAILLFVLAGIADIGPTQPMEPQDRFLRDGKFCALLMNKLEGIAISADFLFVSIAQESLAENNRLDARLLNRYSFNTV